MNILLLGGTGRVGRHILEEALNHRNQVHLVVRNPSKLDLESKHLIIFQGDATNSEVIEKAIVGVDCVISALGTDGVHTLSRYTPLLIEAMYVNKVSRIVTVGTAGILQSRVNPELYRFQSTESRRKSTRAAEEHLTSYLQLKESSLDWTVVCPTYLPDGEKVGNYRVEREFLPVNGERINVPDVASFTYQQLRSGEFSRSRVGIAY